MTNYAYSTITSDEDKLEPGNWFLSAFRDNDRNLPRRVITGDCTWSLSGNRELAGESNGADAVIEKARQFTGQLSLLFSRTCRISIPISLNGAIKAN